MSRAIPLLPLSEPVIGRNLLFRIFYRNRARRDHFTKAILRRVLFFWGVTLLTEQSIPDVSKTHVASKHGELTQRQFLEKLLNPIAMQP
jgi:hypothetical protein